MQIENFRVSIKISFLTRTWYLRSFTLAKRLFVIDELICIHYSLKRSFCDAFLEWLMSWLKDLRSSITIDPLCLTIDHRSWHKYVKRSFICTRFFHRIKSSVSHCSFPVKSILYKFTKTSLLAAVVISRSPLRIQKQIIFIQLCVLFFGFTTYLDVRYVISFWKFTHLFKPFFHFEWFPQEKVYTQNFLHSLRPIKMSKTSSETRHTN